MPPRKRRRLNSKKRDQTPDLCSDEQNSVMPTTASNVFPPDQVRKVDLKQFSNNKEDDIQQPFQNLKSYRETPSSVLDVQSFSRFGNSHFSRFPQHFDYSQVHYDRSVNAVSNSFRRPRTNIASSTCLAQRMAPPVPFIPTPVPFVTAPSTPLPLVPSPSMPGPFIPTPSTPMPNIPTPSNQVPLVQTSSGQVQLGMWHPFCLGSEAFQPPVKQTGMIAPQLLQSNDQMMSSVIPSPVYMIGGSSTSTGAVFGGSSSGAGTVLDLTKKNQDTEHTSPVLMRDRFHSGQREQHINNHQNSNRPSEKYIDCMTSNHAQSFHSEGDSVKQECQLNIDEGSMPWKQNQNNISNRVLLCGNTITHNSSCQSVIKFPEEQFKLPYQPGSMNFDRNNGSQSYPFIPEACCVPTKIPGTDIIRKSPDDCPDCHLAGEEILSVQDSRNTNPKNHNLTENSAKFSETATWVVTSSSVHTNTNYYQEQNSGWINNNQGVWNINTPLNFIEEKNATAPVKIDEDVAVENRCLNVATINSVHENGRNSAESKFNNNELMEKSTTYQEHFDIWLKSSQTRSEDSAYRSEGTEKITLSSYDLPERFSTSFKNNGPPFKQCNTPFGETTKPCQTTQGDLQLDSGIDVTINKPNENSSLTITEKVYDTSGMERPTEKDQYECYPPSLATYSISDFMNQVSPMFMSRPNTPSPGPLYTSTPILSRSPDRYSPEDDKPECTDYDDLEDESSDGNQQELNTPPLLVRKHTGFNVETAEDVVQQLTAKFCSTEDCVYNLEADTETGKKFVSL